MPRTVLTMFFLVEGETEKRYLEWLAAQIERASDRYRVRFRIAVRSSAAVLAKRFQPPPGTRVYTLLDYESTDPVHEAAFRRALRDMRRTAERTGLDFVLGYANFSFELWILLHKVLFTQPVYHRRDYLGAINAVFGTNFQSMPNYKKEQNFMRLLARLTLSDVREAIVRGRDIRRLNLRNGRTELTFQGYRYFRDDPSLSVDVVVADILHRADLGRYVPAD